MIPIFRVKKYVDHCDLQLLMRNIKMNFKKLCLLLIMTFCFFIAFYWNEIYDFIEIDSCLDNGNVWDYKRRICIQSGINEYLKTGGKWDYTAGNCINDHNATEKFFH